MPMTSRTPPRRGSSSRALHWLQHTFGFSGGDGNSPQYLFWSGAGSDLAYLTVAGAAFGAYRRHNCRMRRCWRLGRYEFAGPGGVTQMLCHVHHPDVRHKQLTRERLRLFLGDKPGRG